MVASTDRVTFFFGSFVVMMIILYAVGKIVSLDGREVDWSMSMAGGIASCVAEFCTMPLETSKVRMQLNKGSITLSQAFFEMVRNEGVFSVWNGAVAALCRQFLYQSIKMMIYEPIRDGLAIFGSEPDGTAALWQMVLAGGIAGMIGALLTSPFDLAKVRAQADTSIERTASRMEVVIPNVYRTAGVSALWTGWSASMQRAFIVNSSELATYGYFKMLIMFHMHYGDTLTTHFLASCMAGFVASLTATPPDRIKIILMAADPGMYNGVVDCFIKTVRAQGFLGLYKGFMANWYRMAPWNLLFFVVLEQTYSFLSAN
jgi:solute carrier family 25 (mitochondrial uncoupling protein), member 8/9